MNTNLLIEPIIEYFFQISELKSYLTHNKSLDFQNFKNILISKTGINIKNLKNYQQIFDTILTVLEPNNQMNKDYYNQSEQYDEKKGLKAFIEKHKKCNIIQKLFLIPTENIIFCKKCWMKTFKFNYTKYIYIKNLISDSICKKLFFPQNRIIKGNNCHFCNGRESECSIENKILDYPENLIVIIEPTQANNFNIRLNFIVTNGNTSSYSLNQFIESNTNILY